MRLPWFFCLLSVNKGGVFLTSLIFIIFLSFLITPKVRLLQNTSVYFCVRHRQQGLYGCLGFLKELCTIFLFLQEASGSFAGGYPQVKLNGAVSKPVYVVTKITSKAAFQKQYPAFRLLYEKNGFDFFKREPDSEMKKY